MKRGYSQFSSAFCAIAYSRYLTAMPCDSA